MKVYVVMSGPRAVYGVYTTLEAAKRAIFRGSGAMDASGKPIKLTIEESAIVDSQNQ